MITFKDVEEKDKNFIIKVYRSSREKELSLTTWSELQKHTFIIMQSNAQLADYKNKFKDATYQIIIYKKKPAGRLFLWETNNEIRILDIALLPEFQGKGIGRKILTNIIDSSQQKNKTVSLHVAFNNPAKKLYESLGFKTIRVSNSHEYMEYKTE